MSLKHHLPLLIGVLILTLLGQAQARTFKIATVAPDGTAWMTQMRAGAKIIAERTAERVDFKFYPGGVMGNDPSVLKKMRIGQLQGGALTNGGLSKVYPDVQIYSLPFLFNSYDEVDYVRARMDSLISEGLEKNGLVVIGMSEGGFAYLMSDQPVRRVEDLSQRKVWLPQGDIISETVFKATQVSPVPLSLADVYTGLQTGLIDTFGTTPTAAIAFQWHTKAKYLTDIPLLYLTGLLVMDKKAFAKISPEDQAIVREVMHDAFKKLDIRNRKDDQSARAALKNQGVEFVSPDAQELKRWHVIADESIITLGEKGVYTPGMLKRVNAYLQEIREQKRQTHAH